jgi:hypothetical protein
MAGALAFAATTFLAAAPRPEPAAPFPGQAQGDICDLTTTGRIVAIGDVHGAFDRYVSILRETKLVDGRNRWVGGNAILVHPGDVIDRGDESRKVLNLVRQLEGDARKAGGQVLLLLGNHEVMRMAGDWRYVTKADVDTYRTVESESLRERLYAEVLKANESVARAKGEKFDAKAFRKDFLEKTPLGSVEMELAFSTQGEYGGWLRQHDIMARINGIVFVHAGPGRAFAERGCAAINAQGRQEMKSLSMSDPEIRNRMVWHAEGPLWYRGLVGVAPAATPDDVTAILKALGGTRMVIGHTASTPGRIRVMQDGRVVAIDSGMLGGEMFRDGEPSALEIDKGTYAAVYIGKREVLPIQDPAGKQAATGQVRRQTSR